MLAVWALRDEFRDRFNELYNHFLKRLEEGEAAEQVEGQMDIFEFIAAEEAKRRHPSQRSRGDKNEQIVDHLQRSRYDLHERSQTPSPVWAASEDESYGEGWDH